MKLKAIRFVCFVLVFIEMIDSGVGHVVLQVAASTPCKSCFGIEKAHWPALYAKVTGIFFLLVLDFNCLSTCVHCFVKVLKMNYILYTTSVQIQCSTEIFTLNKFSFKQMSSEFDKWMKFYGKECGPYDLLKGNFLSDDFKDIISNAT